MMRSRNWLLIGASALLTLPLFGSTYYGGAEDWKGGDYDYNDIVFSLAGSNLTLQSSSGQWLTGSASSPGSGPFWDHASTDGAGKGIGYCIYGGGSCNGGVALDPGAKYLATSATASAGSANNVTFSATGQVTVNIAMQITAIRDMLGWYSLSDPNEINWLNAGSKTGTFTFNANGAFGLVEASSYYQFYSQNKYGTPDSVSHFAFFDPPGITAVPEPGASGLLGLALIGSILLYRRTTGRTLESDNRAS
jgi:hypothetical protein